MSKRHFEAIARVLNAARAEMTAHAHATLVRSMADEVATFNPRFSRAQFIRACGITDA